MELKHKEEEVCKRCIHTKRYNDETGGYVYYCKRKNWTKIEEIDTCDFWELEYEQEIANRSW